MNLSQMQRRYIWLAGSYPQLAAIQGRGYRKSYLMFNVNEHAGQLTLFGYGTPFYFLSNRGLFRSLQAPNAYTLTETGEAEFNKMLARGDGMTLNEQIKKVEFRDK